MTWMIGAGRIEASKRFLRYVASSRPVAAAAGTARQDRASICRDGWVADWSEKADALNTLLDRGVRGQCSSHTRSKIGTLISCRKFCIHCPKTRVESSLTWRSANDTATASNESLR